MDPEAVAAKAPPPFPVSFGKGWGGAPPIRHVQGKEPLRQELLGNRAHHVRDRPRRQGGARVSAGQGGGARRRGDGYARPLVRRTKIIATVGPSSAAEGGLPRVVPPGMDVRAVHVFA